MSYTELRGNALIDWTIRDQRERQARMKDGDLSIMERRLREQGIAHAELGRAKGAAARRRAVVVDGVSYSSVAEAARVRGVSPPSMSEWLKRRA